MSDKPYAFARFWIVSRALEYLSDREFHAGKGVIKRCQTAGPENAIPVRQSFPVPARKCRHHVRHSFFCQTKISFTHKELQGVVRQTLFILLYKWEKPIIPSSFPELLSFLPMPLFLLFVPSSMLLPPWSFPAGAPGSCISFSSCFLPCVSGLMEPLFLLCPMPVLSVPLCFAAAGSWGIGAATQAACVSVPMPWLHCCRASALSCRERCGGLERELSRPPSQRLRCRRRLSVLPFLRSVRHGGRSDSLSLLILFMRVLPGQDAAARAGVRLLLDLAMMPLRRAWPGRDSLPVAEERGLAGGRSRAWREEECGVLRRGRPGPVQGGCADAGGVAPRLRIKGLRTRVHPLCMARPLARPDASAGPSAGARHE